MRLPIRAALDAAAGTLLEAGVPPDDVRIVTDTRTLEPGDTFLALRGPNFNGHDYIQEAVRRGAVMLVIDEPHARVEGTPAMLVERTNQAYMALAGAARDLFTGRVIAITGSAGKTTTKVLLGQLLATRYGDRVLAAPANENNEVGVSRLLLNLSNERHDVAVVEMGARHAGDIAQLVAIARPEVGVLTNIGEAHLEIMGSRRELEDTKWAIFALGARAVLNARDAVSTERAASLAEPPHWFAALDDAASFAAPARATAFLGRNRLIECAGGTAREYPVDVRLPGEHNRANLAAALSGALEVGADLEPMIEMLPELELPEGRFQSIRLEGRPRNYFRCVQRQRKRRRGGARRVRAGGGRPPDRGAWQHGGVRRRSGRTARARRRARRRQSRRAAGRRRFRRNSWRAAPAAQGSPRSASCGSRRMVKRWPGCARTRARKTSFCSKARACTS